jgi:hypothetical protein
MANDTPKTPDQAAAKLYDNPTSAPSTPSRPATRAAGPAATGLYVPGQSLRQHAETRDAELFTKLGMGDGERQRLADTAVTATRSSGLPELLTIKLLDAHIDARLEEARPVDDAAGAEQALGARILANNTESLARLVTTYGNAKEAESVLKRVERFVKASPALAELLASGDVGSRPDIVTAIAAHVWSNGLGR